jgi:lauroyl/myristoyl acyltransferase
MSASSEAAGVRPPTATAGQRLRARSVAALADLLAVLPERLVGGLADAVGEAWYRLAPRRASLGRRNLQRVTRHLVANGLASPQLVDAATDGAALEQLLRATFRQAVRYYADLARLPHQGSAEVEARLFVETPETVARAFGPEAPAILVAMHFGAVEYPGRFAVARSQTSILAPMETLADPALQAWVARTRASTGVEIVPLRDARRTLSAALAAGHPVGIVADRNVAGGTLDTPFFGAPAPMPIGPALLAVETGRPIYLGAVRRLGGGRYAGRLYPVPVAAGGHRRERITATMATLAGTMEEAIAVAPEQWWSLLSPIWPDLDPRAAVGTGRLEPSRAEKAG